MPFQSEKQREFIWARARAGEKWAQKFLRDMGLWPPKVKVKPRARHKQRSR